MSDLARQMKELLGVDDGALNGMPSVYRHLARGAPSGKDHVRVVQAELPGGGSEDLRWLSPVEFASRQKSEEHRRFRDAEMSWNAYGPEASRR